MKIYNAIDAKWAGGTTNTAAALSYVRNTMYTSANGERNGVRNVVMVLTDGVSNSKTQTLENARLAR